jgi:hypothetical protein
MQTLDLFQPVFSIKRPSTSLGWAGCTGVFAHANWVSIIKVLLPQRSDLLKK